MKNDIKAVMSGDGDHKILEIREGAALPLHDPGQLKIVGNIRNPFEYYQKRKEGINKLNSHIQVDENQLYLIVNDKSHTSDGIIGSVEIDHRFEEFGINQEKYFDPKDLADFIRPRRRFFKDVSEHGVVYSALKNFKGKVKSEMERYQDDRGNKKLAFDKAVESNMPAGFVLKMPVIQGEGPMEINVELGLDATSEAQVRVWLISPDLDGQVEEIRERLIKAEVDKFNGELPVLYK